MTGSAESDKSTGSSCCELLLASYLLPAVTDFFAIVQASASGFFPPQQERGQTITFHVDSGWSRRQAAADAASTESRISRRPLPRHEPGRPKKGHLPGRCGPTGFSQDA